MRESRRQFEERLRREGHLEEFNEKWQQQRRDPNTGRPLPKQERQTAYRRLVAEHTPPPDLHDDAPDDGAHGGDQLQLLPPEAFGSPGEAAQDAVTWACDHLEGDPPKPHDASPLAWGLYSWASTNASTKKAFFRYVFTSVVPTRGTLPEQRPEDDTGFFRTIKQLRAECEERKRKGLHAL